MENARRSRTGDSSHKLEEANQNRLAKLSEIENSWTASEKGPVFGRPSDRIAAARVLGEKIQQAKSKGVKAHEISEAFERCCRESDVSIGNSARLDRYSFLAGKDTRDKQVQDRLAKRLTQKARPYLKLAEAVANLTSQDSATVKLQVLENTDLWKNWSRHKGQSLGGDVSQVTEQAEQVTYELVELCEKIRREAELEELEKKFSWCRLGTTSSRVDFFRPRWLKTPGIMTIFWRAGKQHQAFLPCLYFVSSMVR